MASKVSDADAKQALKMHNIERRAIYPSTTQHPDLIWCASLARHAQKWAEHMARTGRFGHSNVREHGEGENLSMASGGDYSAADATAGFIDEKRRVRGGMAGVTVGREREVARGAVGHWMQILYGPLRKLGIGLARSRSGATYICVRYDQIQMRGTKVTFPSGWNPGLGWTGSSRGSGGAGSGGEGGSGGHGQNLSTGRNPLSPHRGGGGDGGGSGSGGGNGWPAGLNHLFPPPHQQQFPGWNANGSGNLNLNLNLNPGHHGQHHHHNLNHNHHHGHSQHPQHQPGQNSNILTSLLKNMGLDIAPPKVAGDDLAGKLMGFGVKEKHARRVEEVVRRKVGGRGEGSGRKV